MLEGKKTISGVKTLNSCKVFLSNENQLLKLLMKTLFFPGKTQLNGFLGILTVLWYVFSTMLT